LSRSGRGQEFAAPVQAQVDAALAIGINVLAYATNRELESKEQMFHAQTDKRPSDTVAQGRMSIAKLRHPGGCNAAPRALVTLLETAGRELDIRVDTREHLINITHETLFDHHLVFMHGRNRFRLTDAERKQLKTFIQRGGMLFADSICASGAFTESFRREMSAIFPEHKLQPIPADDPIFTPQRRGPLEGPVAQNSPGVRRHKARRPMGRCLLEIRSKLRPGKARLAGVPRLCPQGRRPNRPEHSSLFPAAVAGMGDPY
jgi:hypothetical protein